MMPKVKPMKKTKKSRAKSERLSHFYPPNFSFCKSRKRQKNEKFIPKITQIFCHNFGLRYERVLKIFSTFIF